jgi:hypothetical protein
MVDKAIQSHDVETEEKTSLFDYFKRQEDYEVKLENIKLIYTNTLGSERMNVRIKNDDKKDAILKFEYSDSDTWELVHILREHEKHFSTDGLDINEVLEEEFRQEYIYNV